MTKLVTKFDKLSKALIALEVIYLKPTLEDRSNIDATIQRFEFTFELFWKLLKEILNKQGLEVQYPKDTIKAAFSSKIIDDEEAWMQMLLDRNITSHTYDEVLADIIFARIRTYVPIIRKAFDNVANIFSARTSMLD